MSFRQLHVFTCLCSYFMIILANSAYFASATGPDVTECYTANGNDYEGSQSHVESPTSNTTNFTPCVRWADAGVADFQSLPNNYCRNSNNSVFPWCFVSVGVGQVEARICDIPTCSTPAYVGCFRPSISTTVTPGATMSTIMTSLMNGPVSPGDPKMKIERCLNFCRSRNYDYAGLTRGHSCVCSKWPDSSATDAALSNANRLPAARCREIQCANDPAHACGGNDAVAVYDTKAGSCQVMYYKLSHGTIYSPRWPGNYVHNLTCSWNVLPPGKIIRSATNYSIVFSFVYFDLHGSQDNLSFLSFAKLSGGTPRFIASYNGSGGVPDELEIPLNKVRSIFVQFQSDGAKARRGFTINFKFRETGNVSTTTEPPVSTSTPTPSAATTLSTTERPATTTTTATTASTVTSSSTTIQKSESTNTSTSTTQEANHDSKETTTTHGPTKPAGQAPSKPPINVIVIGVACALVVLVTVSVVVVIEMKRRRKKVPKEITPPADFKNPVTFNNGSKTVNIV